MSSKQSKHVVLKVVCFTDDSVVDDCGQSSLVSLKTVQVQGQTLEQSLVTHLQQTGPKRLVYKQGNKREIRQDTRVDSDFTFTLVTCIHFTCAVDDVSGDLCELLSEERHVCLSGINSFQHRDGGLALQRVQWKIKI